MERHHWVSEDLFRLDRAEKTLRTNVCQCLRPFSAWSIKYSKNHVQDHTISFTKPNARTILWSIPRPCRLAASENLHLYHRPSACHSSDRKNVILPIERNTNPQSEKKASKILTARCAPHKIDFLARASSDYGGNAKSTKNCAKLI